MKRAAAIVLFAAIIGYGLWWLVFELEPPVMIHDCVKSHTYIVMVPMHIGKTTSLRAQPRRHCDEYGPWYPNPSHAAWVERHADRNVGR